MVPLGRRNGLSVLFSVIGIFREHQYVELDNGMD